MKITPEILRRYALGKCNTLETEAVERWLSDNRQEADPLSGSKVAEAEQKVWAGLERQIHPEVPLWGRMWAFARPAGIPAAAGILLLLCVGLWFTGRFPAGSREITLSNEAGVSSKIIALGGLNLTALPKSKVESRLSITGRSAEISFSGNMEFENTTGDEMVLTIHHALNKSGPARKQIKCKAGKRYVAMYCDYKQGEIFVVAWDDLRKLPPSVMRRALKEFRV